MEKEFITYASNRRLLLLFLGWGMDATPFRDLHKPGYDILAVFGYEHTGNDAFGMLSQQVQGYDEVITVAWSFGVRIATEFLRIYRHRLPLTGCIAVNGTPFHIDDKRGIPHAIAEGTLQGLSEQSLRKFRRRMFATADAFSAFCETAPRRTFDSMHNELEEFVDMDPSPYPEVWQRAVVSGADRIFPPENQLRAWKEAEVEIDLLPDAPHFPDLQRVLDRYVINKELVSRRFADACGSYSENSPVQKDVARKLWSLTANHLAIKHLIPRRIIEAGTGDGTLTSLYAKRFPMSQLELWDIAEVATPSDVPEHTKMRICDAETEINCLADGSIDLFLSASALQWFHSPCTFIESLGRILAPGGLAAIATYGPGTFKEITQASGRTLNYPRLGSLVSAAENASLRVLDSFEETLTLPFGNVIEVMHHIKSTGVNALADNEREARNSALRLMRAYPVDTAGTAALTYVPIYLIVSKPL